ncbi:MalM family protein, partial [Klebsiella pneumoniae]|uniref:MalM family protein n=1 Tax=Klebsiella pneumoniae TaxID=573 RepID=UPI00272F469E
VLDQNRPPAGVFPSTYVTDQQPGVMTAERLGGGMRLTPARGQHKRAVRVVTTAPALPPTTTRLEPAKADATGAGPAAPAIPEP